MKKVLIAIGSIIVLGVIVFTVISLTSKKMVCKSEQGNITIMYNNKTITGYTAKGISYDFDEQKNLADQIGSEEYLNQFKSWFESNTTGTCKK